MPCACSVATKRVEVLTRSDLGIQFIVIVDVVSVHAAGRRLEQRRRIHVGDAEIVQVRHQFPRLLEGEVQVELQPIGRRGDAWPVWCHEPDFKRRSSGTVNFNERSWKFGTDLPLSHQSAAHSRRARAATGCHRRVCKGHGRQAGPGRRDSMSRAAATNARHPRSGWRQHHRPRPCSIRLACRDGMPHAGAQAQALATQRENAGVRVLREFRPVRLRALPKSPRFADQECVPPPSGSLNSGKCANSLRRPSLTSLPSSGVWSVKNRKGVEAAHSCPMKTMGVYGESRSSANAAREAAGAARCSSRSPKARLPDLIMVGDAIQKSLRRKMRAGRAARRPWCFYLSAIAPAVLQLVDQFLGAFRRTPSHTSHRPARPARYGRSRRRTRRPCRCRRDGRHDAGGVAFVLREDIAAALVHQLRDLGEQVPG